MVSNGFPAGGHGAACSSPSDLGDITFVIGGKDYVVPNSDWVTNGNSLVQARHGLSPQLVQIEKDQPKNLTKKDGNCGSSIAQLRMKNDMFLVGNHFMKKYYTVFDRDTDKIGLAEAV